MKKLLIAIPVVLAIVVAVLVVNRMNEKKANLKHVESAVAILNDTTAVLKGITDDASFTAKFADLEATQTALAGLDYGPKRRVVSRDESRKFFPMYQGASEPLKIEAERIIYADSISLESKQKIVTLLRTTLPLEPEIGGKTWMESTLESFQKGHPPTY